MTAEMTELRLMMERRKYRDRVLTAAGKFVREMWVKAFPHRADEAKTLHTQTMRADLIRLIDEQ